MLKRRKGAASRRRSRRGPKSGPADGFPAAAVYGGNKNFSADALVSTSRRVVNVPRALVGGFPDVARVRLNYVEEVAFSNTVSQSQVWTGNGPFDPNVTGTGSQPANYDDWSLMYNRVRCLGSTIQMNFALTTSVPVNVFCGPRHTSTSVVSSSSAIDNATTAPYAKMGRVTSTTFPAAITHSMSTDKFIGQPVRGSDLLQSVVTANPSHLWYWHTSALAADGTTALSSSVRVIITYDLEFFDRLETGLDALEAMEERVKLLRAAKLARKLPPKGLSGLLPTESEEKKVRMDESDDYVTVPRSSLSGGPKADASAPRSDPRVLVDRFPVNGAVRPFKS
jgi:hypothetical protein